MTFSTLCQSYLFEIFLTNWSFTLQTLYAVLSSLNILWRMRRSLMQKVYKGYPTEPKIKSYELKEAHSTWESNATTADINSILVNEHNKSVNIDGSETQPQQQNSSAVTTTVLTTDSTAPKKSETSVIIISNNNNQKDGNLRINDPPSVVDKAIWILMNVSHVLPHVVAFGYWIFVYKYGIQMQTKYTTLIANSKHQTIRLHKICFIDYILGIFCWSLDYKKLKYFFKTTINYWVSWRRLQFWALQGIHSCVQVQISLDILCEFLRRFW